jgi:predicted DNA-binding transcriptional regulator AlpA
VALVGASRAAKPRTDPAAKYVLTVTEVQIYLGLSKRAFFLLRCNRAQAFPAPFVVNGRDRWWRREIYEWAESRKRPNAVPTQCHHAGETAAPHR